MLNGAVLESTRGKKYSEINLASAGSEDQQNTDKRISRVHPFPPLLGTEGRNGWPDRRRGWHRRVRS